MQQPNIDSGEIERAGTGVSDVLNEALQFWMDCDWLSVFLSMFKSLLSGSEPNNIIHHCSYSCGVDSAINFS